MLIPKGDILSGEALAELPQDRPLVLHCKTGARSAEALAAVKAAGFRDAVHVGGGVLGLGQAGRPAPADVLSHAAGVPGALVATAAWAGRRRGRAVRRRAASVSAGLATRPVQGGRPTPYAVAVLEVVDRIPRGKVMSYGDVAEFVGLRHRPDGRRGDEPARSRGAVAAGRAVDRRPNPASPEEALRRLRRSASRCAATGWTCGWPDGTGRR